MIERSRKFQSTFLRGDTPRERYANAFQKKTELPVPANIMEDPSGALSDAYQEARIAVDRYWATLGNEVLVRYPVPARVGNFYSGTMNRKMRGWWLIFIPLAFILIGRSLPARGQQFDELGDPIVEVRER